MANEPWLRMTAKEAIDAWNTWGDRFWKSQAMTDQHRGTAGEEHDPGTRLPRRQTMSEEAPRVYINREWLADVVHLLDQMAAEGVAMDGCADPIDLMTDVVGFYCADTPPQLIQAVRAAIVPLLMEDGKEPRRGWTGPTDTWLIPATADDAAKLLDEIAGTAAEVATTFRFLCR